MSIFDDFSSTVGLLHERFAIRTGGETGQPAPGSDRALYTGGMPHINDSSRQFLLRLLAIWAALVMLFVVLSPASTAPLGWAGRLGFWALHIGVGLGCAGAMARMLVGLPRIPRDWRLILGSALLGVVVFAPAALALEMLFPALTAQPADDALDVWGEQGLWQAIIAEALAVAPAFAAAWLVINLNALLPERMPQKAPESPPSPEAASLPFALPAAIGSDVIAISADLHYLHVHTSKGKAMILGSLAAAAEALGEHGMLVHRSHWVSIHHVRRLKKSAKRWTLEMSGELSVPISRRKRREVTARLGQDFEVVPGHGFASPDGADHQARDKTTIAGQS